MTQCTAITRKGTQCKNSAVTGTNPPRCPIPSHQTDPNAPTRKRAGAPPGNKNAEKHGAYSRVLLVDDLDTQIAELSRRLSDVIQFIDANRGKLTADEYIRFAALQGQLTSRLGRLIRSREDDTDAATKAEIDIDAVLQVLSANFKVDLTGEKKE
jgi:hypothetical protein